MSRFNILLAASIAATCVAASGTATAGDVAAACSVTVDYIHNGVAAETYRKDFVVEQGAPFVDDFSTPTRSKSFTASVNRAGGEIAVAIDYFSDVGVFHAIAFNTSLTIHGGGKIATTSGSHGFSTSTAVTPAAVAGNHATNYTLVCRGA